MARLLRIAAAFAGAGLLVWLAKPWLLAGFIDFMRWELGWIEHPFLIKKIALVSAGGEALIRLDVGLARVVTVAGRVLWPDQGGGSWVTTLTGHVLVPPIVALGVILAWPARRYAEYPLRFVCLLPCLLLVMALDVPLLLLAEAWRPLIEADRQRLPSLLLAWAGFLTGGGRFVLAIAAGLASVLCAERIMALSSFWIARRHTLTATAGASPGTGMTSGR